MKRKDCLYTCCLFLLLILPAGCTRDVILELPPVPPRLVLNASVTSGQDVSACLSKSWFLLDSVPDDYLPAGSIRVFVNDQFRGTMQCTDIPGDTVLLKGQYALPGCRVQPGDRLCLKAESPGFDPVEASTQIPLDIEILSLDTTRYISTDGYDSPEANMRIYTTFRDRPGQQNYYRLMVERLTELRRDDSVMIFSFYSWYNYNIDFVNYSRLRYEDPVFQSVATNPTLEELDALSCRGTFSDQQFDGREYTVKSSIAPADNSFQTDSLTVLVHYDVRLLAISAAYHHYLSVIRNFSVSFGDAFLTGLLEPSATYTNVEGGFGVVAGYQVAYRRITMPFSSTPPYWYSSVSNFPDLPDF